MSDYPRDQQDAAELTQRHGSMLIDDAAKALGKTRRTIYHYIAAGKLQTTKIGITTRVLRESVEQMKRCGS